MTTYISPPDPPQLTVLQALTQGRQAIKAAFPLFSSTRSATPQAPHTLTEICTTTARIGPYSFPSTNLYIVDWTPGPSNRRLVAVAPPSASPAPPPPASPGKLGGGAGPVITPALITRLNAASAKDPALAAILRKAASGQATPTELATLSKKIKAVEKEDAKKAASEQQWEESNEPPLPPALVLEWAENGEKVLFPSHCTYTEVPPTLAQTGTGRSDVLLSCFVFPSAEGKGKQREGYAAPASADGMTPVPIDLVVEDCEERVKDALLRASRTGRARDLAVEDWWRKMSLAVLPRLHIIDPPPAALPPPDATAPLLSRTASFSTTADQLNQHGKRPAVDSGSATPTGGKRGAGGAARGKKRKAPVRRGTARAKSTTADLAPPSSSGAASPHPYPPPTSSHPPSELAMEVPLELPLPLPAVARAKGKPGPKPKPKPKPKGKGKGRGRSAPEEDEEVEEGSPAPAAVRTTARRGRASMPSKKAMEEMEAQRELEGRAGVDPELLG